MKKEWEAPHLEVFGTALEITQGVGNGKWPGVYDDGGRDIDGMQCPGSEYSNGVCAPAPNGG